MAKMKSTKKALLTSVLALTLSSSMLVGTTFAWFTDSVTSTGNKIVAGTLKVDLELLDENGSWNSIKESKAPIFNYDNWEPGYTDVKILKVENEGTLALKWKAKFVSDEELSALANVIDVYVNPSETALTYPTDRTVIGADYEYVGTVADFVNTIEQTTYGTLKADGETGDEAYLGIALKMQESAGNEYQNKKLGDFDIQIVATQLAYEGDSFGTDYDEDAVYPALSTSQKVPANATESMSLSTEDISVDLPAELLNNLPDEVTELAIAHTEPTVDEDTGVLVFDSVELVDQDGNVIDLSNNNVEFTATLPVGDYFENGMILNVYHDDAQIATAPVVNKEVTYSAMHFCEVSLSEKVFITVSFTDGYEKNFTSLKSAMSYGYSGGAQEAITVYEDITEEMGYLEGNIVCGKEGGVTIKNTIVDEWIYCGENFTIGEGVTYDATGYASGLFVYGEDCVINGTVLTDCYYQRYAGVKLTINAPGSMTVKTETFILRYADGDANAGIYINGDNDDSTVEFNVAVVYFYQGMISAKDATLRVGTYWQTNETDGAGSANLVLDNSKLTVTVNEHNFKATGNSTVTLKNGSVLNVAGGIVTTNEIVCDETSQVIKAR